jgi:hypothetical protein
MLERWCGCRRVRGGHAWHTGLAFLAFFQPLHRRNPERFRAAHVPTVAISSENMRTWTSSFTVPPKRPGGGAIVSSFPLW